MCSVVTFKMKCFTQRSNLQMRKRYQRPSKTMGIKTTIDLAILASVESFILISTDRAVRRTNAVAQL